MTTTTLRAALARLQALPWATYANHTAAGFRACWIAAQLITASLALLAAIAYEHREQIRAAVVATIAATFTAGRWTRYQAERCYRAGQWSRRQLMVVADRSAVLVAAQPLPAVAPITAGLAALREALERLIARLYPLVLAG